MDGRQKGLILAAIAILVIISNNPVLYVIGSVLALLILGINVGLMEKSYGWSSEEKKTGIKILIASVVIYYILLIGGIFTAGGPNKEDWGILAGTVLSEFEIMMASPGIISAISFYLYSRNKIKAITLGIITTVVWFLLIVMEILRNFDMH